MWNVEIGALALCVSVSITWGYRTFSNTRCKWFAWVADENGQCGRLFVVRRMAIQFFRIFNPPTGLELMKIVYWFFVLNRGVFLCGPFMEFKGKNRKL